MGIEKQWGKRCRRPNTYRQYWWGECGKKYFFCWGAFENMRKIWGIRCKRPNTTIMMRRMREEIFLLLRRVRKYEKRHWRNLSLGLFPLSIEPVSVSFNLFHNTLFLEEFMPFYTAVSLLISEYFFFLWKFKPLYPFPHLDLITLVIVNRLVLLPQVFVQMLNEFVWIDGELVELPFMRTWEIFEPLDIWWVGVGYLVGHSADLSKIVVNCTFDLMLLWPLTFDLWPIQFPCFSITIFTIFSVWHLVACIVCDHHHHHHHHHHHYHHHHYQHHHHHHHHLTLHGISCQLAWGALSAPSLLLFTPPHEPG